MTQRKAARKGTITPQMEAAARAEGLDSDLLAQGIADGTVVLFANTQHQDVVPTAVGKGLRTKVNANLGTSSDMGDLSAELAKLKAAVDAGTDAVMDLSTGGDLRAIRREILKACRLPLGTVPVYQAAVEATQMRGAVVNMTEEDLFQTIQEQAQDGVDFITVHCGVTLSALERLRRQGRVADVVSRGGAFLIGWMIHHGRENPLYEQFDRLLEICLRYDVTLSLGDGMRPGCLADATDRPQVEEMLVLGELVDRAREAEVQVMVEGPGHVPLDQVAANVILQKRLCREAPFYVLGPLVTDIAPGYDHIAGAIGGALAGAAGADFLCYVTPAEHLSLPDPEDVREGVIAARVAGHAADIAKGIPGAAERDLEMSRARKRLDWETQMRLALDPERARAKRSLHPSKGEACSMCGEYCAMELMARYLGTTSAKC